MRGLSTSEGRVLAILGYALLTSILVAHHEPWRDEVDAWLTARDETPLAVFKLAGYSGTPALWYLLQMPFAKLGLHFATQGILNLLISVSAGAVMLWCSPLPFSLRLVWLFSYYMSFEYAVIARNYALGILLVLSAAALTEKRWERPITYGVVLALLGNVSAHFFFVAGVFWALWTGGNGDAMVKARVRRKTSAPSPRQLDAWQHHRGVRLGFGFLATTAGFGRSVRAGGSPTNRVEVFYCGSLSRAFVSWRCFVASALGNRRLRRHRYLAGK